MSITVLSIVISACGSRESDQAVEAANGGRTTASSTGQAQAAGSTTKGGQAGTTGSSSSTTTTLGSTSSTLPRGSSTSPTSGGTSTGGSPQAASQTQASSTGPATLSKIVLGNVGAYSGVAGALWPDAQEALQVWAKYTNAHGGLNGHIVQVISEDDQGDPSLAVSESEQMIQQDHVLAFVGDMIPFEASAIAPFLAQNHIPLIGTEMSADVEYTSPYIFPQGTSLENSVNALATYFVHKGLTKFAVWTCVESTVCSNGRTAAVNGGFQKAGVQVVQDIDISLTQPSFTTDCLQAKSDGAQVILFLADGASIERGSTDCNQQGYNPVMYNGTLAAAGSMLTTPSIQGNTYFSAGDFPWVDSNTPAQAAYHQALSQYAPGLAPDAANSTQWVAGEIVVAASQFLSATNPTTAQLLQGLYSIKNDTFGGIALPTTYGTGANPGPSCTYLVEVNNNQWTSPIGDTTLCPPS
ncbi:MAG TPA: ABC transporter substrate-binding protein [Acidimicrobiales bacterium]|nr:ABC transporter substrate-binding protein [Acidimicrobiales bacterium]